MSLKIPLNILRKLYINPSVGSYNIQYGQTRPGQQSLFKTSSRTHLKPNKCVTLKTYQETHTPTNILLSNQASDQHRRGRSVFNNVLFIFCNFNQQVHTTVVIIKTIFLKTSNSYIFRNLMVQHQGVNFCCCGIKQLLINILLSRVCRRTEGNFSVQSEYVQRTELLHSTFEQFLNVFEVFTVLRFGNVIFMYHARVQKVQVRLTLSVLSRYFYTVCNVHEFSL